MIRSDAFQSALHDWSELFMQLSMGEMIRYARENGLTMPQVVVLLRVRGKSLCGVGDIGENMGVTSAAASQLLDKLERQDLVLREESPEDRRQRRIRLTARGEEVAGRIMAARGHWIEELEARMSPGELAAASGALALMAAKTREIAAQEMEERRAACSV